MQTFVIPVPHVVQELVEVLCLIQLKTEERSSKRMLNKSSMFQVLIFLKVVKITPQEQVCSAPRSTFPAPVRTFPSSSGLVRFPACPGTPSHNPRGFHAERLSNPCAGPPRHWVSTLSAHQMPVPGHPGTQKIHAESLSNGSCRSCRALLSFELSAHQTAPPIF